MDKKIIFLDLDGTLTNDKKEVTQKTYEALMKIQQEGHVVALASGRPTPGMADIADQLQLDKYEGFVMSFNGGKIIDWKTKEVIFQNAVASKYTETLAEYAKANDIGLITYDESQIIVGTRVDKYIELESKINKIPLKNADIVQYVDYDPNKFLLTADEEMAEKHEKNLAKIFDGKLSIYRSAPYFIEVVPQGIDKAASIEKLINYLGIDQEDTIACGDGYNDLSMIKYAGVGVAMSNAVDVIKENADYITLSNNDDGIAKVIEKFF